MWRVWRGHRCGDIKADRLSLVFARLQVSKRGALTGGYHDPSASHIDIIKAIRTTQKEVRRWGSGHVNWVWIPRFLPVFPIYAKLDEAQTALSDKEAVLANIDAKVASLTAEISKDEMARQELSFSRIGQSTSFLSLSPVMPDALQVEEAQ